MAVNTMPPGMASALDRGASSGPAVSNQLQSFLAAERANGPVASELSTSDYAERAPTVRREGSRREMWLAYLLWWFLGCFGAHRFYLGQGTSAVIMVCALVGSFAMLFILPPVGLVCFLLWCLWLLADAALIPGMTRRYNDSLESPAAAFA